MAAIEERKRKRYCYETKEKTTDISIKTIDDKLYYTYKSCLIITFDYYEKLFKNAPESEFTQLSFPLHSRALELLLEWCNERKMMSVVDNIEYLHDVFIFAYEKECWELVSYCRLFMVKNMKLFIKKRELIEPIAENINLYKSWVNKAMYDAIHNNFEAVLNELVYPTMSINLIMVYFSCWDALIKAMKRYIELCEESAAPELRGLVRKESKDKMVILLAFYSYDDIDTKQIEDIMLNIMEDASIDHNRAIVTSKMTKRLLGMQTFFGRDKV